jgi:hypothetical protein
MPFLNHGMGLMSRGGVSVVGPASVSPLLWLKADAIVGLNDADAVTTWNDSSGGNRHAAQSDAARKPTYKPNVINGKPVVRFVQAAGANTQILKIPHGDEELNLQSDMTIIAVAMTDDSDTMIGKGFQDDGAWLFQPFRNGGVAWGHSGMLQSVTAIGDLRSGSAARICTGTRVGATNPTYTLYSNGVLNNTKVTATDPPSSAGVDTYIGKLRYSANDSDDVNIFAGDIAEILIYGSALSTADRLACDTYLAAKYNITLA